MSQQRSPDTGLEIWEAERAAAGVYDPSIPPDERPTQACRRAARKRGRAAVAEALREWRREAAED